MLAGADGVLLGGQAEGVPADGMQDVTALGTAIAGEDIGGGVALGMADMEAGPGGVGEHVEDVELGGEGGGGSGLAAETVALGEGMVRGDHLSGIERAKGLFAFPVLLPTGFDQVKWKLPTCHVG